MPVLNITVITDIHYGFDSRNKLGSKVPRLMDKFVKAAQKSPSTIVVEMGDRISTKDRETDIFFSKQVKEYFNQIAKPAFHLIGNHDDKFMTPEDNEAITGSPSSSYSMDHEGYHLVFWNPNVNVMEKPLDGVRGVDAYPEHLEWLEQDLKSTDKPTIVFSHFPLDAKSLDRLPENSPGRCFGYLNSARIQQILEDSGKVLLCLSGHNHEDRRNTMNGIHYATLQSVAEAVPGSRKRKPHARYTELSINEDTISLELKRLNNKKTRIIEFPRPTLEI